MVISGLRRKLNAASIITGLYILSGLMTLLMFVGLAVIFFAFTNNYTVFIFVAITIAGVLVTFTLIKRIKTDLKKVVNNQGVMGDWKLNPGPEAYQEKQILRLSTSLNQMADRLRENAQKLRLAEQRLIKQKRKTESSKRAKQTFLVNISHEIRTPMNGILGFARILEASIKDKNNRESLQMIIKSADQLMTILNDILDFSRLAAGNIDFVREPFILKDTVNANHVLMKPEAELKGIELQYTINGKVPEVIGGDALRLGQILLNLTSNAIKFTEKGRVDVLVSVIDEEDGEITLEFCVKDTGIGIALEQQQKVFDFFEQATNDTSRRYSGTGLGLSIVKKLVELQGGEVFLDSMLGKGSDFYFRLPFTKVTENEVKAPVKVMLPEPIATVEAGKGVRVLIVEDNPINQMLVIKLLGIQGYETTVAQNGRIALEAYKDADFDIILMDLQMPEMDGYETTRMIRKMDVDKRDVPIVAMTAHTIKGELEKCLSIGMNDYISKPFHSSELYHKIEALVDSDVFTKK